jgi:hypothetical protein
MQTTGFQNEVRPDTDAKQQHRAALPAGSKCEQGGCERGVEFMRNPYETARAEQIEIVRTNGRGTARLCGWPNFGRAWKGIFPIGAAAELASRTHVAIRTAEYELAGEREPSSRSIAALVGLCATKYE